MKHTKAIIVLCHGSRSEEALAEFDQVVDLVRLKMNGTIVTGAHMELAQPDIMTVFNVLANRCITDVLVIPYFLFNGNHIKHDIPLLLEQVKTRHPDITISFGKPLGADPLLADVLIKRIEENF